MTVAIALVGGVPQITSHVWTDGAAALTAAFPGDCAAGNFIFVLAADRNRTYTTVPTDTLGTTYVVDHTGVETSSSVARVTIYRSTAALSSGGANTISLTHGFGDERQLVAVEVSSLATSPLDKTPAVSDATHWGTGNDTGTTTGTLSQADEIIFSLITGRSSAAFSSITTPSGFTGLGTAYMGGAATNNSPGDFAYQIVSATTAVAPTWGSSGSGVFNGAILTATYKGAAAGGGGKPYYAYAQQ